MVMRIYQNLGTTSNGKFMSAVSPGFECNNICDQIHTCVMMHDINVLPDTRLHRFIPYHWSHACEQSVRQGLGCARVCLHVCESFHPCFLPFTSLLW
jgi:hypothetical protein